jgi:Immunity protein 50
VSYEAVAGYEALVERFGRWPSFHDAEVLALRLDDGSRSDGRVSLEIDVHVFEITREIDAFGYLVLRHHTLVTLRFDGVSELELDTFGRQNALDALLLDLDGAELTVGLPANNGLEASFRCESGTVVAVEPYEPGPHSVYGRPREPLCRIAAADGDPPVVFADERGVRLLVAQLRGVADVGTVIRLGEPPRGPRLGPLVVHPTDAPLSVEVRPDRELRVSGSPDALAGLACTLEAYLEHNDLDDPGMHMHVDPADRPRPDWLAADSVPLIVATWSWSA